MDHATARRRVTSILGHVAPMDSELSSLISPHLFVLNCSSTLNTMLGRRDNTVLFARQGSASQATFMRQVSAKQNSVCSNFPSETTKPLFSSQTQTQTGYPSPKFDAPLYSADEAPKFARQYNGKSEKARVFCNRSNALSDCKGMEWSPPVDVAESGTNYVVTIELPGVRIMDIRVEVDDQKLTVTGKRSTEQWAAANGSNNSNVKYHRREILDGPYRVVWPLPNNVNKDIVSAEFV